jgi:aldehyde reductase
VKREDLFITSKLWNTFHRSDLVEPTIKQTLADFGLDYVDLYLMHWPFAYKEGEDLHPMHSDNTAVLSDVDYFDTWKAMERVLSKGLTKNIGVSNFNSKQITRLLENAIIKPVTNQVNVNS